jgi:methylated-DNA-protein-cysteine methyltransferase-like protein
VIPVGTQNTDETCASGQIGAGARGAKPKAQPASKKGLFERVYQLVRRVPGGRVVTYGQIAAALGDVRLARTVGWAMRACPDDVPWHRVVNARGGLSTAPLQGELYVQRMLLEDEGVQFDQQGCVDLDTYGWNELQKK